LATDRTVADLRGPTACTVATPDDVRAVLAAAGPDPRTAGPDGEAEFVRRLTSRRVAVGQLLMDQAVVSGIGNIYRAEMLFRAALDPYTRGTQVPAETARELWQDWTVLLDDGVRTGVMVTRADLSDADRRRALRDRALRHAVYGRAGEPCLRCGTRVAVADMAGRTLYWCPGCQTG
ncbi:DNA glycosylase, partial [Actinotalea ferrariae CF5-4]